MYRIEKATEDIVVEGFDQGIAASPHKGIATIKNGNISTESGEVMASFARIQQSMTDTTATGSLAFIDTNHVSLSIANTNNLFKGNWITVTGSSNTTQLPNGTYYVPPSTGSNFQLANYYNAMNYTPATVAISMLVVGGGGSGGTGTGNSAGGGGGAGGVKTATPSILDSVAYTVTVGAAGVASSVAGTGITTTTADAGGGGGGGVSGSGANGASGASGGGAGAQTNTTGGTGGAGTAGEGNNGGNSTANLTAQGGAGGGGAGGIGADKINNGGIGAGGAGGVGISSSISGTAVFYGGGGGGGANNGGSAGAGAGGNGGGGAGGTGASGTAGTANTGGGGGAGTTGAAGGSGIVIISVPTGQVTATGGTKTTIGGNDIWTFTSSGTWTPTILPITVPTILTGFTTGLTASFTMTAIMGKPIAKATETYYAGTGLSYHRYYILDTNGRVWLYDDQNEILFSPSDNVNWILPDYQTSWLGFAVASGLAVISGFLIIATSAGLFAKPVVALGNTNTQATTWVQFADTDAEGWRGSGFNTSIPHFCLSTHTVQLYVTDASYVVSIFPDSALADPGNSTSQNVQTLCKVGTYSSSTEASAIIISGTTAQTDDGKRLPVVFFTVNNGVLPNSITAGTVYYVDLLADNTNFQVYSASTGGSPLDIETGQSGPLYFNSFYPIASASASTGAKPTYTFTNPALALPTFEIAQTMTEIGNGAGSTILVGCAGNVVYPWDQKATQATTIISLPEANVVNIITVNQMGYIFAGNKGNIYITDGSTASAIVSVPDYCAGIPGSPATYIEPIFAWGDAAYVRGRVYFSILDQTASKAGNIGGIWSFVPTQNFYIGQDVGISLRLENQSSYATYNGYASVLITKQTQNAIGPQYWSGWESDINTPSYGIDFTGTGTSALLPTIIESDAIPTGTLLDKKTFSQIEYKLSAPLDTGATVQAFYRKDLTSAWRSCGTTIETMSNHISGYFPSVFERTQWLQVQIILTPITSSASTNSFVRLTELRIR